LGFIAIDRRPRFKETNMDELESLRYPVGRLPRRAAPLDARERTDVIATIDQAPARFRSLVAGLTDPQLDTPYRPGGWTIRQVVHHVPDSHMNAYVRMKLAVTEDGPAIRTYEESRWAELPEAKTGPIEMSLALLEALHTRWVAFLRALPESEFAKAFVHPQWGRVTVDEALTMYAWHCRHHAAHIAGALEREA
jgi:hypothetical protein